MKTPKKDQFKLYYNTGTDSKTNDIANYFRSENFNVVNQNHNKFQIQVQDKRIYFLIKESRGRSNKITLFLSLHELHYGIIRRIAKVVKINESTPYNDNTSRIDLEFGAMVAREIIKTFNANIKEEQKRQLTKQLNQMKLCGTVTRLIANSGTEEKYSCDNKMSYYGTSSDGAVRILNKNNIQVCAVSKDVNESNQCVKYLFSFGYNSYTVPEENLEEFFGHFLYTLDYAKF